MALQFDSNLQNLVYQMDEGTGRQVIQAVLFALFAFAMAALVTFTNFQGLKNARAMDEAQLARNLAEGAGLRTQCVRPLSIGHLAARSPEGAASVQSHPDLMNPPVWPVLLAGIFRITGIPDTGVPTTSNVFGWDYVPVGLSHFFTMLSALWVWMIARRLFDRRAAVLSAFSFLISDLTWGASLKGGGLSAAVFFGLGAVYATLRAAEPSEAPPEEGGGAAWRWLLPLALAAGMTVLAILTRYGTAALVPVIFLYLGISRRRRPWAVACLYAGLVLLMLVPWMVRNTALSGHAFGLTGMELLSGTHLFPGDVLVRTLEPEWPDFGAALYYVQLKMIANLRQFVSGGLGLASGGVLLGLFAAMYLHRFVRPSSRTLRWCLLPGVAVLVLSASAFGEDSLDTLAVFWPLAIPYAWAFFLVLLDRLQFEVRFLAGVAMAGVMFLAGLPLLLNVLPPRSGLTYPPYFHRYIGWISSMADPGECMVTDIPWAVAWYGGKTAVQLPRNIEGFLEIHRRHHPVAMAYFTPLTRDKPWVRGLTDPSATDHDWYQLFAAGRVPETFPLTHGRFVAGNDQLILADRPRW